MSGPRARVVHLHTAREAKAPLENQERVRAETAQGIVGDRYHGRQPRRNVTLVQEDILLAACEAIGTDYRPGCSRRNITVEGIDLGGLVGRRFRVGEALLEGVEICEPCAFMEETIGKGAMRELVHKCGLRARVVEGGDIRVGDPLEVD